MKPLVPSYISSSQSAFVPGREISESIILLREVLHSFQLSGYNNQEFCLKVDLSKAFDRMDWSFLESMMAIYGFPTKFVALIMSCVKSAEFTIVINGRGDDFFKPKYGLRQGCALSPYLFILGMDLLLRTLNYLVGAGFLQGVRLARTADPLTASLYADDLLLFGKATTQEATIIVQVLQSFSLVLGQQMGPEKSTIWFSSCTDPGKKGHLRGAQSTP